MTMHDTADTPPTTVEPASRKSRTLTVGEVMDRLANVDRSLPVVFDSEDQPLGCYGVRSMEIVSMQRETVHEEDRDVYHDTGDFGYMQKFYDEPEDVALLSMHAEPSGKGAPL